MQNLEGKTIIITGANCGIGYETALELARRGARVILACRDEKKGQAAVDKIKEETNNNNVELELLNLASFRSIKDFSERIKSRLSRLDVLINNAGLVQEFFNKTEDGYETTFAVNHLGPYFLTRLLLDLIKKSAPSRIINVSSVGHIGVKMNWDDLQTEKHYNIFAAYRQSKLCNVLFTTELAAQLNGTGVSAVCLHPGFVRSEIMRTRDETSLIGRIALVLIKPLFRMLSVSCPNGALTSIHCATSDDVMNNSGAYYDKCKIVQASSEGTNRESSRRLWKISAQMIGLNE